MTAQDLSRPYLRTPVLSPDGKRIAFVYAMDVWLVSADGGTAERLSAFPADHHSPVWAPDSSALAVCSNRVGAGDVYILPLENGEVQRITAHSQLNTPVAWSPDGKYLYFTSGRELQENAIYRVDCTGGTPVCWLAQPYEALDHMAISPDGNKIAFNVVRASWWRRDPGPYSGCELWVASNAVDAQDFRRLAADYCGRNRWPMWAADGSGVYFVSDRDGVENIWFEPLEGGLARQITTFRDGRVLWPSIGGNGAAIVFERDCLIWRLDLATGAVGSLDVRVRPDTKQPPTRSLIYNRELSELALAPDGKKVAYVVRGEVFVDFADKETDRERRIGSSFRVTNTPFREADIDWSRDSQSLVYTSDRHGDPEIYHYHITSRTEKRLTEASVRKYGPTYSPNGAWLAYVQGDDEIRLIDTATGTDRAFVRANLALGTSYTWSPDSNWLVFCAQDERAFRNVYVQHVNETEAHQISFLSNLTAYGPIWSSDGQFIVFTTGQYREEHQIVRVDLQPRRPQFREDEFEKLFAPKDERKSQPEAAPVPAEPVAPVAAEAEAATSETTDDKAADGNGDARAADAPEEAAAAPIAAPQTSQKQIVIQFEGIERRREFLTTPQLDAAACAISPDARDLIFEATIAGKTNLWAMPLDELRADHPPRQLTASATFKSAVQFAPDGKSFFYLDGGIITIRKFPGGDVSQLQISAEVNVDFHQEKRQVFEESWRVLRDYFYDPTFRGLDWNAVREQFRPLANGAQTPQDLRAILNLMVGELRASHTGVSGFGRTPDDGYIGVLWDSHAQVATGQMRIAGVIPESPAALAGVRPGEVMVAIDGQQVTDGFSLDAMLQRTIGRRVRLSLADGEGNTREVAVRPIASYEYDGLRYSAWVEANESYVHRISNGRLGYVHIRSMSYSAYQRFLSDLDSEAHSKEGVVIDVRFNGGGHIGTFILDVLTRRSVVLNAYRGRQPVDAAHASGNRVLNKPTVLIINEGSGSNTEMFAEGYRRLALGSIVGRPTAGAVIGTYGRTLLDGTRLRVPAHRISTLEGEDLEGTGRAVDVDVALPLGATARGQDTQLDAAVNTLLAQIDAAAQE